MCIVGWLDDGISGYVMSGTTFAQNYSRRSLTTVLL